MEREAASKLVAIDTQILIWGVRGQGEEWQREQAQWLFEELDENNAQVVVPSIVVAEYLTHVADTHRGSVLAALSDRFIIAPFDAECVVEAARLYELGDTMRPRGKEGSRHVLRADANIIATARCKQAAILYTADEKCRKLASKVMNARGLPDQPPTLFSGS